MTIPFIDADTVTRSLEWGRLVDALDRQHREGIDAAERLLLEQPGRGEAPDGFLIWPAWQRGKALGIKVVTSFPANPATRPDLPAVQALYLLFDGADGAPLAVIDGTALTYRKTAADSALGARYLARADARSLLMVGAGALAPALVEAHCAVRPSIESVKVWNRTPVKAAALADRLAAAGRKAGAVTDLAAAVGAADVICCATGARAPLIEGDWLKPGQHLDLVGGFTPEMREADARALARARVYVDSRRFTLGICGDLVQAIAEGAITEDSVLGDLFDLAQGHLAGREDAEAITLFKNAGGGHLDLMTARCLCAALGIAGGAGGR